MFVEFCRGLSPAEADMALLETARRCEMYGVKLHPAKVLESDTISLSARLLSLMSGFASNCDWNRFFS